jgi:hypothetical protein
MDHSPDFHAASQPMQAMKEVGPGRSVTYEFRAARTQARPRLRSSASYLQAAAARLVFDGAWPAAGVSEGWALMTGSKIDGFRLGIYVFEDAEVVDFAAPYGVFSVARRYDPALDVFLVAETLRPVQAQAGFTVLPNYDLPAARR